MLSHYLKIALRNMRRFRLQTIVCLTGLAVGMTCFALGTLWLRYIESFEDFVPDAENIYLVMQGSGKNMFSSGCFYYTDVTKGEQLREHVPGLTESCFLVYMPTYNVEHGLTAGDKELTVSAAITDSAYIRIFGIEAVEGSLQRFRDGDIAITRSLAQRVFGQETAIGREVMLEAVPGEERKPFSVVAVIADRPQNSQFRYDLLACCDAVGHPAPPADGQSSYIFLTNACSFVKFAPSVPRDSIVGTHRMAYVNEHGRDTVQYTFAPLTQMRTDFISDNVIISTNYVRWFMMLGLLVILCSLANYVITMVSHLRRRGWEFSLRRVLGSSHVHILYMVSVETLLTMLLAAALACIFTVLVLPFFREYSGIDIAWSAMAQRLAVYLTMVIVGGMALSSLTAWIVMRRIQGSILASRQLKHSSNLLDRAGICLQMALSMGIILCAVVMLRQVRMLMYSDELGFLHNDRGVVYHAPEELRARIQQSSLVVESHACDKSLFPRRSYSASGGAAKDEKDVDKHDTYVDCLDDRIHQDMFYFYGMELVCGKLPVHGKYESLTREEMVDAIYNDQHIQATQTHKVKDIAINETYCSKLGWSAENAIGKSLWTRWAEYRISGVVRDVYVNGPTSAPSAIKYEPMKEWEGAHFVFRSQPGRMAELCDSIRQWIAGLDKEVGKRIEVVDCEAAFNKFVSSEQMLIKILFTVGGASLFVCVIGTFSLISLSLQQRRKEIAIRKVHGAKTTDILRLFMRSHVVSLFVAALVAYPVAYIIMRHWLEGYQKQVAIDWWLVPITFGSIAAVVTASIGLNIWYSARESTVAALNV